MEDNKDEFPGLSEEDTQEFLDQEQGERYDRANSEYDSLGNRRYP